MRMCLIKTITLKVDQSTLTGETNPVNKHIEIVDKKEGAGVIDKLNLLFSSTLVVNGSAVGVVTTTGKFKIFMKLGMKTEIGTI